MNFEASPENQQEPPGNEPQEEAVKPVINNDALVAERDRLNEEDEVQRDQDAERAGTIVGAVKQGLTGQNLRRVVDGVIGVAALAGGTLHAEAAPTPENTQKEEPSSAQQEQREQKSPVVKGVASDPVLGQFTVEANLLGTKRDGSFGFEFEVMINGEQKVVQSSRRLRNGATFIAVEGGIEIDVPAKYGAGSGKPDTLTVVGKDGNPVKMNIERR